MPSWELYGLPPISAPISTPFLALFGSPAFPEGYIKLFYLPSLWALPDKTASACGWKWSWCEYNKRAKGKRLLKAKQSSETPGKKSCVKVIIRPKRIYKHTLAFAVINYMPVSSLTSEEASLYFVALPAFNNLTDFSLLQTVHMRVGTS